MGVGDPAAAVHEVATRKLLQGGGGGGRGAGRHQRSRQEGGLAGVCSLAQVLNTDHQGFGPGRRVQPGPGFEYGPPGFGTRQEGGLAGVCSLAQVLNLNRARDGN